MMNIMEDRTIQKSFPDALVPILRTFGSDMAAARKVRRMTQVEMSQKLGVSRQTVHSMERGDPRVNFGTYAMAAWVMGLERGLLEVFSPDRDPVYQRQSRLGLAKRVREPAGQSLGDLDF